MQPYRAPLFGNLPTVIKNLLIINVLMFFIDVVFQMRFRVDLSQFLALHYVLSPDFRPYQFVSYMFMHGSITHIFFNMFALVMFGRVLEVVWGQKRFLTFYFVTGIGAALLQLLVIHIQVSHLTSIMPVDKVNLVLEQGATILKQGKNYIDPSMSKLNLLINVPMIGASGAVFGVLLAFGMLFPNTQLMLLFPPIPIKAKYFVIIYGAIELFAAVIPLQGDNVAHFAHLGGMLFGYFLIKYWNKKGIGKYGGFH